MCDSDCSYQFDAVYPFHILDANQKSLSALKTSVTISDKMKNKKLVDPAESVPQLFARWGTGTARSRSEAMFAEHYEQGENLYTPERREYVLQLLTVVIEAIDEIAVIETEAKNAMRGETGEQF